MPENNIKQEIEPKEKESLINYLAFWVEESCGNNPALLINSNIKEDDEILIELQEVLDKYRYKLITANILIPSRPIICRKNLQGLKELSANLLEKLNS